MRTIVDLDEKLVTEGLRVARVKTKRELVVVALQEFVARRKRKELLEMEGRARWVGDLEEMRKARS